jgi:hypothetical protein
MQLLHDRHVPFADCSMLTRDEKMLKKALKAAIDAFSHLMLIDDKGFILTSSLKKKDFDKEVEELKDLIRSRVIFEE